MQTSENINVSIIIPTWNRKNVLVECIEALINQKEFDKNFEIIICDSNSTDGTEDRILEIKRSRKLNNLALIHCKHNNVSSKRNAGIKLAKFNYIILLDDDCIVFNDYLKNFIKHFKVINNNEILCGQYRTNEKEISKSNYVRYRDSRNFTSSLFYFDKKDELTFNRIVTGNLGFKKEIIISKKIFFNEEILGYGCEDVDWAYRLISNGFKIYKTEIKVFHNETSNSLSNYKMKWFYMANGSMPLLMKHNYSAASQLSMFFLEDKNKKTMSRMYSYFAKLLLNRYLVRLLENFLSITDQHRIFYIPFLFRCVLLGAYIDGIKQRKSEDISEEDTRKGWYAQGKK